MAKTYYVKALDDNNDNENDDDSVELNDGGHATPPPLTRHERDCPVEM
jgi:hypothetical protein